MAQTTRVEHYVGEMNYNFTDRTKTVLALSREEAIALQHDYVGTAHILLGLVREGEGVAAAALITLNADLGHIRQSVLKLLSKGDTPVTLAELPYTTRGKGALEAALAEARSLNHSYVGTEHLLLGLLREDHGIAAKVLNTFGVTFDAARSEILKLLGQHDSRS